MNTGQFLIYFVLFGLTILCAFIPINSGKKETGKSVGIILSGLITITLFKSSNYFVILILPLIFAFQIIFILYWTFRKFGKQKAGKLTTLFLTIGFILLLMYPWISDWTYNKKDVRKVLLFHKINLEEDFKILANESGGLRDYYETFTLKISDKDFNKISQQIKNSKNYKGYFTDYSNLPSAKYEILDTIDFENPNFFQREYFSQEKMNNGTYHFSFKLDKKEKQLRYAGSDE